MGNLQNSVNRKMRIDPRWLCLEEQAQRQLDLRQGPRGVCCAFATKLASR